MSQDLFAAFVGSAEDTQYSQPTFNPRGQAAIQIEEDDWGEFEGAENVAQAPIPSSVATLPPSKKHQYSLDDLGPSTSILGNSSVCKTEPVPSKVSDGFELLGYAQDQELTTATSDNNVLFDADEPSEADDFGDFGDFNSSKQPVERQTAQFDLLGLDDETGLQSNTDAKEELGRLDRSSMAFGATTKEARTKNEPSSQSALDQEEETWDDFSAWDNDATQQPVPAKVVNTSKVSLNLKMLLKATSALSDDAVPPTNVPPPAVILSILPSIFTKVEDDLLKPAAHQSLKPRQQIYRAQNTYDYLASYIKILTVFARVVAGRKLRWKRDTILAQSMRIGSASAGRVSGMKVTSIDKSELKKEDGEVAEALAVWSAQAGRVKTAVHEARKVRPELALVPEVKEVMSVKSVKEVDGGIPSAKPCALCGLKREERIVKVDGDVLDSFGEWWIEITNMHTSCRDFWSEYEVALRQR